MTTWGGMAGIGLGRLLGREHASTPKSVVVAPRLLKRSLTRLYHYNCCCCCVLCCVLCVVCCCWLCVVVGCVLLVVACCVLLCIVVYCCALLCIVVHCCVLLCIVVCCCVLCCCCCCVFLLKQKHRCAHFSMSSDSDEEPNLKHLPVVRNKGHVNTCPELLCLDRHSTDTCRSSSRIACSWNSTLRSKEPTRETTPAIADGAGIGPRLPARRPSERHRMPMTWARLQLMTEVQQSPRQLSLHPRVCTATTARA